MVFSESLSPRTAASGSHNRKESLRAGEVFFTTIQVSNDHHCCPGSGSPGWPYRNVIVLRRQWLGLVVTDGTLEPLVRSFLIFWESRMDDNGRATGTGQRIKYENRSHLSPKARMANLRRPDTFARKHRFGDHRSLANRDNDPSKCNKIFRIV